jgi:hypothetical protein
MTKAYHILHIARVMVSFAVQKGAELQMLSVPESMRQVGLVVE